MGMGAWIFCMTFEHENDLTSTAITLCVPGWLWCIASLISLTLSFQRVCMARVFMGLYI